MFNDDSTAAKQFSMGDMEWLLTLKIFFCRISKRFHFMLSFNESYNNALRQGQMDLHVRYWNRKKKIG